MKDARVDKLADILVDYSGRIQENELVTIRGNYVAEPLMLAIYERCLQRGALPMLRPSIPAAEPLFYRFAQDHQLEYVWETERWMNENIDATFAILSDTNTRQLSRVDTSKQVKAQKARKPLLDNFFARAARGEVKWNVTLFPTEAIAMEAQMSLAEYEDFYYSACLLDTEDPVAEWRKIAAKHQKLVEWMQGRSEVRIEGEGTDITLDVTDRIWLPADGQENFPDGEIFTGPVENKTHGYVTYSFPAIYNGTAVEGARLEFADGRVVNATARQNEEFLVKTLDTDPGARVLGELGIGTNFGIKEFTGEILLDEKIGGTIHLALGASYPESGGLNESAIHWDMVCDLRQGGRITVDGETLMEDGKLLV